MEPKSASFAKTQFTRGPQFGTVSSVANPSILGALSAGFPSSTSLSSRTFRRTKKKKRRSTNGATEMWLTILLMTMATPKTKMR